MPKMAKTVTFCQKICFHLGELKNYNYIKFKNNQENNDSNKSSQINVEETRDVSDTYLSYMISKLKSKKIDFNLQFFKDFEKPGDKLERDMLLLCY